MTNSISSQTSVSKNAVEKAQAQKFWHRLTQDEAVREAAAVFVVQRIVLSVIAAVFGWLVLPYFPHPWAVSAAYLPLDSDPILRLVAAPWQRWDTDHFLQIAAFGYNSTNGNTAFAPLFPLLTAILGRVLLGHYMLAGLIVANAAYFGALVYAYKLAKLLFDAKTARYTLQFIAFFPTAFFLLTAYTDSLYLFLALAAFYYAEKNKWGWVALALALASITRLQGVVLVVPLLFLFAQQRKFNSANLTKQDLWRVLALILSPLTLVFFYGYVYFIVGDHNFNQQLERVWQVRLVTPWESLFGGIMQLGSPTEQNAGIMYDYLNLACILVFSWQIIRWLIHKLPLTYFIYCTLLMLVFLTRQKEGDLWMSMSRYVLALFPVFMLVAWRSKRRSTRTLLFTLGALFQVIFVIIFLLWKWIA